jgi:DNA-binding MarR family transcriptional regulator
LEPDVVDTVDLGQLGQNMGYMLRRAQLTVFADFHRCFDEIDIRPAQFAVLLVLHQTPGLRQSQVADALGIKRANFVTLFDGLIARDLVARVPVPHDRRAVTLHLTPAGDALMPDLLERMSRHEQHVINRLGLPAHARLIALLHQLT